MVFNRFSRRSFVICSGAFSIAIVVSACATQAETPIPVEFNLDTARALLHPATRDFLGITEDQQKLLEDLAEVHEARKSELQDAISRIRFKSKEDAERFANRYSEVARSDIIEILTKRQVNALTIK